MPDNWRIAAQWVRSSGFWPFVGLHAALAIVLSLSPLTNVLGFERAFFQGLLSAFTTPFLASRALREGRKSIEGLGAPSAFFFTLILACIALVPSIVLGACVELMTGTCLPEQGLLFMLLLPVANSIAGCALGVFVASVCGPTRWQTGLLILCQAGLLLASGVRFWVEPQIALFDPLFGYWPGSLYDEGRTVSVALVASRCFSTAMAATGVALAHWMAVGKSRGKLSPAFFSYGLLWIGLGGLCLAVGLRHEDLGFSLSRATLMRRLSLHVTTPHFDIYTDPSTPDALAHRLAMDHEFRYHQLSEFLSVSTRRRIRSFVYQDVEQKAALLGASHTQLARPWDGEIHIHGIQSPHPTLKHELVHVLAAEWSDSALKMPTSLGIFPNMSLVEGLAVAGDWPIGTLDMHQRARVLQKMDMLPDLERTWGGIRFWQAASHRAYVASGSFVRFLADTYGREPLRILYRVSDTQVAYGRPLRELLEAWRDFLQDQVVPEEALAQASEQLKRPGVFEKTCAHAQTLILREGHEHLRRGDTQSAEAALLRYRTYRPDDPAPWWNLAESLGRGQHLQDAQRILTSPPLNALADDPRQIEAIANLDWRKSKRDEAGTTYRQLSAQAIEPSDQRRLELKAYGTTLANGAERDIRSILLDDLPQCSQALLTGTLAESYPDQPWLHYLHGLYLEASSLPEAATLAYHRAQKAGVTNKTLAAILPFVEARAELQGGHADAALLHLSEPSTLESRGLPHGILEDWRARARFERAFPTEGIKVDRAPFGQYE
jgi:hypothetical protein